MKSYVFPLSPLTCVFRLFVLFPRFLYILPFFFLLLGPNVTAYAALPDNLIAQWKLNEGSGLTAIDTSGNGNTGALVNGPLWTIDTGNQALAFDGVNDLVTLDGFGVNASSQLTIAARIKYNRIASRPYGYIFGSRLLAFYADRDNRRLCFTSDNTRTVCSDFNSLVLDTWQHVAVMLDAVNGRVRFYINGVKTERPTGMTLAATSGFAIGNFPDVRGTVRPFAGAIYDVQVYKQVLSDTEITALAAGATPTIPQPTPAQFDFSVSNGGSRTVAAGASVTNTITTALTTGSSQQVSFWAANLPTGAAVSFAGSPCTPTCATTITITTSASTPPGTSTITVTGSGGGITKNTSFNLTVTETPQALTPQGDLLAYWPLNEGSSTVAHDASGLNNDGTLVNGPTWTTGKSGAALAFDGKNDYVEANSAADDFNKDMGTIAAWIYRTFADDTTRYPTPISIGAGAKDVVEVFYLPDTDHFRFHYKAGGVNDVVDVPANQIPVNQWVHIALSWDTTADAFKAYVNGNQVGTTQTNLGKWANTTDKVCIGSAITGDPTADGWQGSVDEVRIYKRALVTTEIQALAGGATPLPSPPPPSTQFDFTVTNAGNRSVTAGASVSNALTTTLTAGTSQPVSFSATGLPIGATATFSASQCTPTCLLNVTIATSNSTPAGTSPVTVTGSGGGVSKTTVFNLTVAAAPAPTPVPAPTPPATPTDGGVSDAPLTPANTRILIVAQDGSGQYATIGAAAAVSLPGDTIQIKNGTYRETITINRSGTRALPITYMASPGHTPKIIGGVLTYASWFIIDGLDITNAGSTALAVYYFSGLNATTVHGNITIRNNYIHDAGHMGAFVQGTSNTLLENNRFERNGLGDNNCTSPLWDGQNYAHCHGIYLSKPGNDAADATSEDKAICERSLSNVTIRRNEFIGNTGSGIQIISNRCTVPHSKHLIENNVFVNNATGMYVWNVVDSIIRNNTLIQTDWVSPQKNALVLFDIGGAQRNLFANNSLYFTKTETFPIRTLGTLATSTNTWRNTAIFYPENGRIWLTITGASDERVVQPLSEAFFQASLKDPSPVIRKITDPQIDPAGFVNFSGGDYHLRADSPLRNAGANAYCSAVDADGTSRPQEAVCDIGAYEFK